MKQERSLARAFLSGGLVNATACALWLAILSGVTCAQSGRRLPDWNEKKTPPPAAPDPTPTPSSRPDKTPLVVTSHLADIITSSSILTRIVSDALIERLNQDSSFSVTRAGEMNRKEASDHAKSMSKGYVVWFQLETGLDQAGIGPNAQNQLYVSFIIYRPETGKILSQGHVYQRPYGTPGGGPLPSPTGGTQIEYRLRRAGRETGDRVLQALGKTTAPGH